MTRFGALRQAVLLALGVLVVCSVAGVSRTLAAEQGPRVTGLRVGFEGRYKLGYWTPVEIVLVGGDRDAKVTLELTVPDGDGIPSRVISPPFRLPAGKSTPVMTYVKFGRPRSELELVARIEGQPTIARTIGQTPDADGLVLPSALSSQQPLILWIGGPMGIDEALSRSARQSEPTVAVRLPDGGHLPDRWHGYEGVDLVVFEAADAPLNQFLADHPQRLEALDEWLRLGGKLLLTAGAGAAGPLTSGPLARFAPGLVDGVATVQRTSGLETYSAANVRIPLGRNPKDGLKILRLRDVRGTVDCREGDLPIVVRTERGFGEVVCLTVDLTRPPLSAWSARPALVHRIVAGGDDRVRADESRDAASTSGLLGFNDLAAQLRGALDQFAGVRLIPFALVAGLGLVYLLLIGPVDYFFLKKFARRMEWTWLTFPALAIAFGAGAWWLALSYKGREMRVNQVDLVDVSAGKVRGTTWLNVFSPRTEAYDLQLRPNLFDKGGTQTGATLMSWFGLPGSGLGGMESATADTLADLRHYELSPQQAGLWDVPIEIWSTKSFTGRWHGELPGGLDARLTPAGDGMAAGTITNRLDVTLQDCMLACGRWAYPIGQFRPGQTVTLRPGEQRDLQHVLKDSRLVREEKNNLTQVATPYDQSSFDFKSILRQMMFYRASGGYHYTGLANQYQQFVDLSGRLELGSALLLGVAEESSAAELLRREVGPDEAQGRGSAGSEAGLKESAADRWTALDAPGKRFTFYRFVLPLDGADAGQASAQTQR